MCLAGPVSPFLKPRSAPKNTPLKASLHTKRGKTGSSNLWAASEVHVSGHDRWGPALHRGGRSHGKASPGFCSWMTALVWGGPPREGSWFLEFAETLQPVMSPCTELPPPATQPALWFQVLSPGDGRRTPGAEGASGQLLCAQCPAQDRCGQDASENALLVGRGRGSRRNHWLILGCVSCQLSAAPAPESRAGDTEGVVGLLREQFLLRGCVQ